MIETCQSDMEWRKAEVNKYQSMRVLPSGPRLMWTLRYPRDLETRSLKKVMMGRYSSVKWHRTDFENQNRIERHKAK